MTAPAGPIRRAYFIGFLMLLCAAAARMRAAEVHQISQRRLFFERNVGQADARVLFYGRTPGYALFLTPEGVTLGFADQVSTSRIEMKVVGGNQNAKLHGEGIPASQSNYFTGHDRSQWFTDVPAYARVSQSDVYEHIDLSYYATGGELEYDFTVRPHGDVSRVQIAFPGADTRILPSGAVTISRDGHTVELRRPRAYQYVSGARREVRVEYKRLEGGAYRISRWALRPRC